MVRGQLQWPVMRGLSTLMVLLLSSAVAASVLGRLGRIPKGSSLNNMLKGIALGGGRCQPSHQEDRAISRRYQLKGPKDVTSNLFKVQKKWNDINRLNSAFPFTSHYGPRPARSSSTRRSCWFQYFTKCPKESSSPRRFPQEDSSSSDSTSDGIIQRAVLKALGY